MATDRSYVTENQTQLARLEALVNKLSDRELSRPLEAGWTVAGVLAHEIGRASCRERVYLCV